MTETVGITDTAAATSTEAAVPPLAGTPTGATATVANPLSRRIVRGAPSRDLEPVYSAASGESFAVVGRNRARAIGFQVVLPDSSAPWILATLVEVSVGLDTLPVTQP